MSESSASPATGERFTEEELMKLLDYARKGVPIYPEEMQRLIEEHIEIRQTSRSETACRDSVIEECAKKCEWYAGTLDNEYNRKNFGKIQDLQEPYYEMAEQLRALKNAAPQSPGSATTGSVPPPSATSDGAAPVSAPSARRQIPEELAGAILAYVTSIDRSSPAMKEKLIGELGEFVALNVRHFK